MLTLETISCLVSDFDLLPHCLSSLTPNRWLQGDKNIWHILTLQTRTDTHILVHNSFIHICLRGKLGCPWCRPRVYVIYVQFTHPITDRLSLKWTITNSQRLNSKSSSKPDRVKWFGVDDVLNNLLKRKPAGFCKAAEKPEASTS